MVVDFKNIKWRGNKNLDKEYVKNAIPTFLGKIVMNKEM